MAESEGELKSLLMKMKEDSEEAGLKLNIQKMKIMASGPIMANRWENSDRLYFLGLQKSLQMVIAVMELKDACFLEENLWKNLDSILKSRDITLLTKVHLVEAMVFPVVMYGCESWTIKNAERRRIDAFELWYGEDSWECLGLQGDQTCQY